MFCPVCKTEFRPGFTECSDCHLRLVPKLPAEPEGEPVEYEEVLYAFNPAGVAFIKSVLDAEGITYYFLGEYFPYALAVPARLMVKKDEVKRAKEILKDATI